MAKEDDEKESTVVETESSQATKVLRDCFSSGGINLGVICSEAPVEFRGNLQPIGVQVDSAWVLLKIGRCVLRTVSVKDRHLFVAWVGLGGKGKLDAQFYRVHGKLPEKDPGGESTHSTPRPRGHERLRASYYAEMYRQTNLA